MSVDDKINSDARASISSKYKVHSDIVELLCKSGFVIVYETSMLDRRLVKVVDFDLKHFQSLSTNGSKQGFGGIFMLISGDYLELLPIVPFR